MNVWQLVLDGAHASRSNMAKDLAMFESVISGTRAGVLRIYNWSEPAVTFGFHQKSFTPSDPTAELPLLKRPTGGGAVLHGNDITFSLSVPAVGKFSRGIEQSCRTVTGIFATALQNCGLAAEMKGDCTAFSSICFRRSSPVELCIGGAKVLGLAALRKQGFMLFQGVMPLSVDAGLARRVFGAQGDPGLKGLCDHDPGFDENKFLACLTDAFASQADLLFSQCSGDDGQDHHDDEGEVHLRREKPGHEHLAEK